MVQPWMGSELARDRMAAFRAEAVQDGRVRRARTGRRRGPHGSMRLALGIRLVSAGYRLLGDTVEAR